MKTSQLDEVDRKLLAALTTAPRAPFRLLADVIGVSDQTIARRYRRLTENAGLSVHGLVRSQRAGWVDWIIRLQIVPGSDGPVLDALARRPDIRWVQLYSGGSEIVCSLQARTQEQRNTLLLRGLSGRRDIKAVTAYSILHKFTPDAYAGCSHALSAAQLAALRDNVPHPRDIAGARAKANATVLRPDDDPLIAELARDGRAPVAGLAAATNWHESTVRRRIEELWRAGLLYFDVDIDESALAIGVCVMLWLKVETAHLEAAGRALASDQEVPFAAATTGPTNLAVSAKFGDTSQLYAYLTTRVAGLPGLQSEEAAPIIRTVKKEGAWGGPATHPERLLS